MEASRLMLFIIGNTKTQTDQSMEKYDLAKFYEDSEENERAGSIIFCKNNICVKHIPGYLTLKACTINDEYTRLILHWTSNALLQESVVKDDQIQATKDLTLDDEFNPSVFHVDLTEMKTLKFFFKEDNSSGHFVVGNHENHYKVLRFDFGGLNHLVEIFENWSLCKSVKLPIPERARKKVFTVVPIYSISPNQSFEESRYKPMTKSRWKLFLNNAGQLEDVANFRKEVFFGGLFPDVRHEVWPFLLHYYPYHSRESERKSIKEKRSKEYEDINKQRLNMCKEEYDKFWLNVQCTVDKDVVRTDRSHPYFAGNDNPNIEVMRQILLNYAFFRPDVGYNQGMSDLLASILSTLQDEVDAFWCFVGLMERSLFVTSPKDDSMDLQLLYLKELLRMMATKFYAHLLLEDEGMDLLFCHRWLLLGFKREFHDMHLLRMWEACWSHYQTEYFHIFIAVAMVLEYGDSVWQKSMKVDEMINYFNTLAMEMDGDKVLKQARSILYQFRRLAGIPCTLRGLLSGPGAWDSASLPEIECTCHETDSCKYINTPRRGESFVNENAGIMKRVEEISIMGAGQKNETFSKEVKVDKSLEQEKLKENAEMLKDVEEKSVTSEERNDETLIEETKTEEGFLQEESLENRTLEQGQCLEHDTNSKQNEKETDSNELDCEEQQIIENSSELKGEREEDESTNLNDKVSNEKETTVESEVQEKQNDLNNEESEMMNKKHVVHEPGVNAFELNEREKKDYIHKEEIQDIAETKYQENAENDVEIMNKQEMCDNMKERSWRAESKTCFDNSQ